MNCKCIEENGQIINSCGSHTRWARSIIDEREVKVKMEEQVKIIEIIKQFGYDRCNHYKTFVDDLLLHLIDKLRRK